MIKCWKCGEEATLTMNTSGNEGVLGWYRITANKHMRSYCDKCFDEKYQQDKEENELFIRLKKKRMFETAVSNLEKQNIDIYEMKDAIDAVEEIVEEKPDKFDSSYEVMVAIILVHNRVRCKMQYRVGKYQVDFLIPELMVVLEVDGERHKHRKAYDSIRDEKIVKALGNGWHVVRVTTDMLDMNATRLLKAIDKAVDYKETGVYTTR